MGDAPFVVVWVIQKKNDQMKKKMMIERVIVIVWMLKNNLPEKATV